MINFYSIKKMKNCNKKREKKYGGAFATLGGLQVFYQSKQNQKNYFNSFLLINSWRNAWVLKNLPNLVA